MWENINVVLEISGTGIYAPSFLLFPLKRIDKKLVKRTFLVGNNDN